MNMDTLKFGGKNMNQTHSCCNKKTDPLFRITSLIVLIGYLFHLAQIHFNIEHIKMFNQSVFDIFNKMWWGVLVGIIFVGIIELVPKDAVNKLLGSGDGPKGIIRAACAGIFFDLCSHGILLVAMKLYNKGVSLPQIIAFLVASPWNSISLTFILIALIGLKWTFLFIILSFIVAIISGFIFQFLNKKKILPENPHKKDKDFAITAGYKQIFKDEYKDKKLNANFFLTTFKNSFNESEIILRWIFVGVILASLIKAFVPNHLFMHYFGASTLGLFMTLIVTTIIEVCSEGSVPIAADILNRAMAPGNAFVFLMAGIATDYTELLALKETTKSWKVSLFLPIVTVPQILILGYLINML